MSAEEIQRLAHLRDQGLITEEQFEEQKRRQLRGGPAIRKSWLITALLGTAFLFSGWYFGSPYWTLNQIRSAVEVQDTDKLVSYFEIPAIRENLKSQMRSELLGKAMDNDDPFSAMAGMAGAAMADGMIDSFVSEQGLTKLMRDGFAKGEKGPLAEDVEIKRVSFDRFVAAAPRGKRKLIFERFGFGWKIVDIIDAKTPEAQPAQAAKSALNTNQTAIPADPPTFEAAETDRTQEQYSAAEQACLGHWESKDGESFYLNYTDRLVNTPYDGGVGEEPYEVEGPSIIYWTGDTRMQITCKKGSAALSNSYDREVVIYYPVTD